MQRSIRGRLQLSLLGVVLMGAFLIWVRIASLLFALFFGTMAWPPLSEFLNVLLLTGQGLGLIVCFPLIGHATWHAYRSLITIEDPKPAAPAS